MAKKVVHKKVKNGNVTYCMTQISPNMETTRDDKKVTCKKCKAATKRDNDRDEERRASYRAIQNARRRY